MFGAPVGDERIVCRIDELCCKPCEPKPLIRVANLVARVSSEFQHGLVARYKALWDKIESGVIFDENNDARIAELSQMSEGLVEGDWFYEVTRSSV
jgi:hypothetical protein